MKRSDVNMSKRIFIIDGQEVDARNIGAVTAIGDDQGLRLVMDMMGKSASQFENGMIVTKVKCNCTDPHMTFRRWVVIKECLDLLAFCVPNHVAFCTVADMVGFEKVDFHPFLNDVQNTIDQATVMDEHQLPDHIMQIATHNLYETACKHNDIIEDEFDESVDYRMISMDHCAICLNHVEKYHVAVKG